MVKAKTYLAIVTTLALIATACGPKSNYRAKDFKLPVGTTGGGGGAGGGGFPAAPTTEEGKKFASSIDFIGVAMAKKDDQFTLLVYINEKTGENVLRYRVRMEGSKNDFEVKELSRLINGNRVSYQDDKFKIEAKCLDENCDRVDLRLGIEEVEPLAVSVQVFNGEKSVSVASEDQPVDVRVEGLLGTLRVQHSRVRLSDVQFDMLTMISSDGKITAFGINAKKPGQVNHMIQDLPVVYTQHLGIETAVYVAKDDEDDNGIAPGFELTLRGQDAKVLAVLKVEPVPVPLPATQNQVSVNAPDISGQSQARPQTPAPANTVPGDQGQPPVPVDQDRPSTTDNNPGEPSPGDQGQPPTPASGGHSPTVHIVPPDRRVE